jgi:hypothetical protein
VGDANREISMPAESLTEGYLLLFGVSDSSELKKANFEDRVGIDKRHNVLCAAPRFRVNKPKETGARSARAHSAAKTYYSAH